MLIGSIGAGDFAEVKRQIASANLIIDGIELRRDLMSVSDAEYQKLQLLAQKPLVGDEVMAFHDFEKTPENLDAILKSLMARPAKIYKIACMATSTLDALRMLLFVRSKRKEGIPLAGMCMGPLGALTRILAPCVGSLLTYASIGKETAPGQLSAEELIERYRFKTLSPKTRLFGLIGHPVAQSPSHQTHNAFFQQEGIDAIYVKMDVRREELEQFFPLAKAVGFEGLSVTIPHKEAVMRAGDFYSERAKAIGAVNTLHFTKEGVWGDNTDASAALDVLGEVEGKRLLLLGAGGSARAIAFEATRRGAMLFIWSRTKMRAEKLASEFGGRAVDAPIQDYDILINATPDGMPINKSELVSGACVMDINLSSTPLLEAAKRLGCKTLDGRAMFERQAIGQFSRWEIIPQTQSL